MPALTLSQKTSVGQRLRYEVRPSDLRLLLEFNLHRRQIVKGTADRFPGTDRECAFLGVGQTDAITGLRNVCPGMQRTQGISSNDSERAGVPRKATRIACCSSMPSDGS